MELFPTIAEVYYRSIALTASAGCLDLPHASLVLALHPTSDNCGSTKRMNKLNQRDFYAPELPQV
jgi:hypothetical protein